MMIRHSLRLAVYNVAFEFVPEQKQVRRAEGKKNTRQEDRMCPSCYTTGKEIVHKYLTVTSRCSFALSDSA